VADKMNLNNLLTAALAALALLSAGSIVLTTENCAQGVGAVLSVQLELSNLELREEGDPEVLVTFRLKNGSAVNVELETFDVYLHIDGHYIGTSYTPFAKRSVDGFEETTMDFVVPISPARAPFFEEARQKEDFSWFVRGKAKLLLPSFKQETWLYVREQWTGE